MIKSSRLFTMFVFISFFLALSSCEQPVGGEKKPKMGYVTLSLAGEADEAEARTITPSTPSPGEFKVFRLWFTDLPNRAKEPVIEYRTMAELENPIELEVGQYELEVTAYLDIDTDGITPIQPAAHTTLTIDISQGRGSKYVITLKAIIDNTTAVDPEDDEDDPAPAQGVFRWLIPCNFNKSRVTATMQIQTLTTPTQTLRTIELADENGNETFTGKVTLSGTESLDVGYYNVLITLRTSVVVPNLNGVTNPTTVQKTVVIRDILHVYRYLESVMSDLLFTDENFDYNYYTVTFEYNNNTAPSPSTIAFGGTRSKPANDPQRSLYLFDDWYSDRECTIPHDFTQKVTKDMTVYANWLGDLAQAEISQPANAPYTYDGWEQTPYYSVRHDGKTLQLYSHFTYSAENATNAGTADFFITAVPGSGYTGSTGGHFTIRKKPVTIVVKKVYDGTLTATLNDVEVSGKIGNDDVTVAGLPNNVIATFTDKNAGKNKPITVTGLQLGNMLSGADAGNYELTAGNITGTITPRRVRFSSSTFVLGSDYPHYYDGTTVYKGNFYISTAMTQVLLTENNTGYGYVQGDNLYTIRGDATLSDKNVSRNQNYVTFDGWSLGGTDAVNYEVVGQPPGYWTIIYPRTICIDLPLIVTPPVIKPYDGTKTVPASALDRSRKPALTSGYWNFIDGDNVTLNTPANYNNITIEYDTKDVDDYKNILCGFEGCTLTGTDAYNYELKTGSWTSRGRITRPAATITGSIPPKTFNGGGPDITGLSIVGKAATDNIVISHPDGNWPAGAGTYTVTPVLTGADAANYSPPTTSVTYTITKKDVTLTAYVPSSKPYDGTTTATVTSVTVNGAVSGWSVSASGSASYNTPDVGTNKPVTFSGFYLTGSDQNNYNLVGGNPPATTANIERGTPAVTWPPVIGLNSGTGGLFGALSAFSGQTLANVSIPSNMGGARIASSTTTVPGTFTWTTPSTSVGAVGTRTHSMTFTPSNTTTWNTVTANVNIYVVPKPEMVFVPGATFQMGNNSEYTPNSQPVHTVTLSAFYVSKGMILINQYSRVNNDDNDITLGIPGDGYASGSPSTSQTIFDDKFLNPTVYHQRRGANMGGARGFITGHFSFVSAALFCNNLSVMEGFQPVYTINGTTVTANMGNTGYRLPTEAEWEYYAKTTYDDYWGYLDFYDYEWVGDWYGDYSASAQTNPTGPASGTSRVVRDTERRGEANYNAYYFRIVRKQ